MKLLIHDLEKENFNEIFGTIKEDVMVIDDNNTIRNCIGCFGCWIKKPGECVIVDDYNNMGELLSKCIELIIISRCFYGGFSPFVKNVIDRCNAYAHPYFDIRNNELHHRRRYNNNFELSVYFYGENITEKEKMTAKKLIQANAINKDCGIKNIMFVQNINSIKDLEGVAI